MRCRELGNYLTKCLDIPAIADDVEFRTFLGFPSNFMNVKARAYSVMPEKIDHGEAGDGDEEDAESSSDSETSVSKPPPALSAPPLSVSNSSLPIASSSSSSSTSTAKATPAKDLKGAAASALAIPSPPTDEDGVAMFDYAGTEAGELAFTIGEVVHMIESEAPPDWAAGYTDKSTAEKPGYFPRSFVRPFTSEDYIYNSATQTWSLREDIANFTYDPNARTYNYCNPPRPLAKTLYK